MDPASMFWIHPEKKASGWVAGESEGTPEVLLTKARSGIPDSGIPWAYDWSILTSLVSTRRFITLIGNVMR